MNSYTKFHGNPFNGYWDSSNLYIHTVIFKLPNYIAWLKTDEDMKSMININKSNIQTPLHYQGHIIFIHLQLVHE